MDGCFLQMEIRISFPFDDLLVSEFGQFFLSLFFDFHSIRLFKVHVSGYVVFLEFRLLSCKVLDLLKKVILIKKTFGCFDVF